MKKLLFTLLFSFPVVLLYGMEKELQEFQENEQLLCAIYQAGEIIDNLQREITSNHKTPLQISSLKIRKGQLMNLQKGWCRTCEAMDGKSKQEQIKLLAQLWCRRVGDSDENIDKYVKEVAECYGPWLFEELG